MFPNLRLLIAAVLTSVVALSCGFGVFAAFRVNHEPLSRLPTNTAALQLVTDEAAPIAATGGALPALQLSEVHIGNAVTAAPALAPDRRDAIEPPNPLPQVPAGPATAIEAPPQEHASQPTSAPATLPAPTAPRLQTVSAPTAAVSAPITPPTPAAGAAAPVTQPAPAASAPAPQPAAPEVQADRPPPAVKLDAAGKSGEPPNAAVPAIAAVEPAAVQAPPVEQPADVTSTVPEAAAPEAKVAKKLVHRHQSRPRTLRQTARKPPGPRRVAGRRRIIRRTRAAADAPFADQTSTFHAPVFQSAPGFQQRPATRRRTAKTTAKDGDAGGSLTWPNSQ